jgi:hypothetical protein
VHGLFGWLCVLRTTRYMVCMCGWVCVSVMHGLVYPLCAFKSYVPEALSLFASSRIKKFRMGLSNISKLVSLEY